MPTASLSFVNALPIRSTAVPSHTVLIGDWRGTDRTELAHITDRTLTVNLAEPTTVSFTVAGDDAEAGLLHEGVSDVWWIRDGVTMARVRLVASTDTLETTRYTISCECVDYRGLLDQQVVITPDADYSESHGIPAEGDLGRVYDASTGAGHTTQWSQEAIVWDLIDTAQGYPGGDLGITKGIYPSTGVKKDITYRNGDTVLEAVNSLVQMDPGIEYNIDTDRKLNLYYPQRGADRGVKLDYGGLITRVNRATDLRSHYANWTQTSGDIALPNNPKVIAVPNLGSRPEGRWAKVFPDTSPSISTESALDAAARRNFATASDPTPKYDLGLRPGAWDGPNHIWVGDVVTVHIQRGRLNVATRTRVRQLALSLDQSNNETVTVQVGLPPADPVRYIAMALKNLGRR